MTVKKTSHGTYVEHAWKVVLNQLDRGLIRNGKTLVKQSQIQFQSIKNGKVLAQMNSKGFDGGIYLIEIPCVDNWEDSADRLADWFAHHLNWFSACLTGEWCNEFFSFVEQSGLSLFPKQTFIQELQNESSCTCHSSEPICKHMIGVIYKMISDMEDNPIRAMELVCIHPDTLMDKIHELSSEWVKDIPQLQKSNEKIHVFEDFYPHIWNCEKTAYNKQEHIQRFSNTSQINPELDEDETKKLRSIYMAWE